MLGLFQRVGGLLEFIARFLQIFLGLLRIILGIRSSLFGLLSGFLKLFSSLFEFGLKIGVTLFGAFLDLGQSLGNFLGGLGGDLSSGLHLFGGLFQYLIDVAGNLLSFLNFFVSQLAGGFGLALLFRCGCGDLLDLLGLLLNGLLFLFQFSHFFGKFLELIDLIFFLWVFGFLSNLLELLLQHFLGVR